MAEQLYNNLARHKLNTIASCQGNIPIVVQSFSVAGLIKFRTLSDLPLVLLMSYTDATPDIDWEGISAIANGVGPNYEYLFNWEPPADFISTDPEMAPFIQLAHAHNLAVHPYTFQDDNLHLADNAWDEVQMYVNAGIDGLFNEFPHSTYNLLSVFGSKANFPPQDTQFTNRSRYFLN